MTRVMNCPNPKKFILVDPFSYNVSVTGDCQYWQYKLQAKGYQRLTSLAAAMVSVTIARTSFSFVR
jgi:hypothetical protein